MGGKILKFELEGTMACFKKYYSNKNVLSYYIPPRTVIIGMLASILGLKKDSYYKVFSSENINISLKIKDESKKYVTPMNHLKSGGGRRQVRHEFLIPKNNKISFIIYLYFKSFKYKDLLIKKIKDKELGYGISLGQSQFKGYIKNEAIFNSFKIIDNYKGEISTITSIKNIIEINNLEENTLIKDIFPLNFKEIKKGREPFKYKNILYEKSGRNLYGEFNKVIKVDNRYISFFDNGDL